MRPAQTVADDELQPAPPVVGCPTSTATRDRLVPRGGAGALLPAADDRAAGGQHGREHADRHVATGCHDAVT
jgi:hypothetical protein